MKKLGLILLVVMSVGWLAANERVHFHFPPEKAERPVARREARVGIGFSPMAPDEFKIHNKTQLWPSFRLNFKY